MVLICFAAFPLPPLFLVVVAVAVTARLEVCLEVSCLEVARGAAAEEDDDDDDEEEEEEEGEEERDGKNGAVCCDE